jgi:trk system potassium uptake protein TrkH
MLLVLGLAVLVCWGISLYYQDPVQVQSGLAVSAATIIAAGLIMALLTRGRVDLSRRDGFGIVTLGWVSASVFGALPFIFTGTIPDPVAAIFETMSGFTTTGASVLTALEEFPRGVMFWRAMTHWFGGMGVLVLCVAILPFLGVGGMQIYRAEMPGPSKDRLTPRIATTAKLLWGVYVLLCAILTGLLCLGGMTWFDALCHTFATMATGGFSTRTASVGAYNSAYFDIVIIVFMFLAGTNFALHYRALAGRPLAYFRDSEFIFYLCFWGGACLLLTLNVWGAVYESFGQALRMAFFQGTSIMTTTGFVTADFDLWPNASRILLVLLMFVGGCAGSTGGGIKVIRVAIVLKKVRRELRRFVRPQAVLALKLGGKPVDQSIVSHIAAFFVMFILLFAVITLSMTFFTPDIETAFTSVIATMGNIGPGLAAVGATQNYADIPAAGKAILTFCMLLGRLELYTVLIVLLPSTWQK